MSHDMCFFQQFGILTSVDLTGKCHNHTQQTSLRYGSVATISVSISRCNNHIEKKREKMTLNRSPESSLFQEKVSEYDQEHNTEDQPTIQECCNNIIIDIIRC